MSHDDAPPAETRLVLIRHGESVSTVDQTIGGPRTCSGLTDAGRAQCARLADRLARTGELADCVLYASQYRRAQETAALIAASVGGPEVLIDAGFGELDPGPECDGLVFADFVERYGPPAWDSDDLDAVIFPGGETVAQLQRRVVEAIDSVVAAHAGRVVAVCTHGGVVDAALRNVVGVASRNGFDLWTTNTSLTGLTDRSPGRWRIDRYNDAAHLQ